MKTKNIGLFVSLLLFVLFLSGCSTMTTVHVAGMDLGFGVERFGVTVHNNFYQGSVMKVCLLIFGWRGPGYEGYRDPILGHEAEIYFERSSYETTTDREVFVSPPCIVLDRQYVVVLVTWCDGTGRRLATSSYVLYPGGGNHSWHADVYPSPGQYDRRFVDQGGSTVFP